MKCYAYTLRGGDVLFVPIDASVVRYTPTLSTEDQIELDAVAALFGGAPHQAEVALPRSTRTPKTKRRKQHHPRTPNKFFARRRLVMEHGLSAAAEAEGVSAQSVGQMAKRYGWKVANKHKRVDAGAA